MDILSTSRLIRKGKGSQVSSFEIKFIRTPPVLQFEFFLLVLQYLVLAEPDRVPGGELLLPPLPEVLLDLGLQPGRLVYQAADDAKASRGKMGRRKRNTFKFTAAVGDAVTAFICCRSSLFLMLRRNWIAPYHVVALTTLFHHFPPYGPQQRANTHTHTTSQYESPGNYSVPPFRRRLSLSPLLLL